MTLYGRGWNLPTPPLEVPFELNYNSPQAAGLVAWWPMIASRGMGKLRDMGGRGLDGTFNGGLTWAADGQMGVALKFDGSSGYIDAGGAPCLAWGTGDFTVSGWINTSTSGFAWLAEKGDDVLTASWRLYLRSSAPYVRFSVGTTNTSVGPTDYRDGKWHHLAGVRSGDNALVYVDGALIQTITGVAAVNVTSALNLLLGVQYSTGVKANYLNGAICQVVARNIAASPSIIWQMYDPATRWELYRPIRRFWPAFVGGAVSISPDLAGLGGVNIGGVA